MELIQPYLDYFALHPNWALAVVFFTAMGEALLVIGLFVPSSATLVGAGTLVGVGRLSFWPVMIAAILGCVVGDQISFWAGRIYGDRLRGMWPLRNYPHLLAKGEEYVKKHGGKSIAVGRFVPGIKSVIPGIAGMFGMNQMYFLIINVASGIVWGAMHILPGVLLALLAHWWFQSAYRKYSAVATSGKRASTARCARANSRISVFCLSCAISATALAFTGGASAM